MILGDDIINPEARETNDAIVRLNLMAQRTIRWAINNKAKFSVMNNPDVSRYADDALMESMGEFVKRVFTALKEAQKIGFRTGASDKALLFYAIGAPRGIAAAIADDLISSVLGIDDGEDFVAELANKIVPLSSP